MASRLPVLISFFMAATGVAMTARAAEPVPEPPLPLLAPSDGATLLASLAPARSADVTPPPAHHRIGDNFAARRLAFFAQTGIGGPYGLLGFSADYSFSRFAAAEVGLGFGGTAPEFSAMLYPRIPLSIGFAIGGGRDAAFPGSAVLVEKNGERWKAVGYADLTADKCRVDRHRDGRDVLVCWSGAGAGLAGFVFFVFVIDFNRSRKPSRSRSSSATTRIAWARAAAICRTA
jgi:hypothetical protein